MTSPNKAKGSAWERAVVEFLRKAGWPYAERRIAGSAKDRGDIAGVVGVVIEAKNKASIDLAAWVDEADLERENDGAWLGVVWHKRRMRTSAGHGYVTMTGEQFVTLLGRALDTPVMLPSADGEDPAAVAR